MVYLDTPSSKSKPVNLHIIKNIVDTDVNAPCGYSSAMASPYDKNIWTKLDIKNEFAFTTPVTTDKVKDTRLFHPNSDYFPGRVRVGDLNVDGYPDILFTAYSADNKKSYGFPLLLVNDNGAISYGSDDSSLSKLYSVANGKALESYEVLYASFFDFDETGSLGIWMVIHDEHHSYTRLKGFFNFIST